jgi:ribosomal protein L7/L12
MIIKTVEHIRISARQSTVDVLGHDRIELDAVLAYARVMACRGRMVQAIKYLRGELGLGLREAKHIADDLRTEVIEDMGVNHD